MGACRESRKSERHFLRILQSVRNMDKLLWLGSGHHMEDLREEANSIKQDLDTVLEERTREIQEEIDRKKQRQERNTNLLSGAIEKLGQTEPLRNA